MVPNLRPVCRSEMQSSKVYDAMREIRVWSKSRWRDKTVPIFTMNLTISTSEDYFYISQIILISSSWISPFAL